MYIHGYGMRLAGRAHFEGRAWRLTHSSLSMVALMVEVGGWVLGKSKDEKGVDVRFEAGQG